MCAEVLKKFKKKLIQPKALICDPCVEEEEELK